MVWFFRRVKPFFFSVGVFVGPRRLLMGKSEKVCSRLAIAPSFMMAEEGGRTAEDPRMATTAEQDITIVRQDIAAVKRKISAIDHCLKGRNSSNAPEEIREEVLIYEGANKAFLFQFLGKLTDEITALLQNQQTVKSEGSN